MTAKLNSATRSLETIVPGDILSTNADALRKEILEAIDASGLGASWDTLVMDLRAARMVDSVGLNLLVAIIKTLGGRGRKLRLLVSSPHVKRALRFTRLDQIAAVEGV